MKIQRSILAAFLALGSVSTAFAQMFGGGFTLGFPQDEFGESLDRIGWGLGGEALYVVDYPNVPVGLGVDFNYFRLGTETRREPFSYTIPDLTVDVTRSNNMVNFHLVGRFIVPMKSFRPYFDVYGGGNYLWTQTTIEERYSSGNDDDDEIASDVNLDDFAWSYGVGGGIQILISDDESTRVYIDLKARQLWGTKAEYLREGDIIVDDSVLPPEVYYYVNYTETDMFTVLLGISVQTGL